MSLVTAIRRANAPGRPEDSIRLRVACTLAVLVAVAGCSFLGAVAWTTAGAAAGLIVGGMAFSYATRVHPPGWVKVAAAIASVAAMVWFYVQVSGGPITDVTTVEDALTLLFLCVITVHSFHVPSTKDLMFSLGASAGVIAIAAAQAVDMGFGVYAVAWVASSVWALVEVWRSASGGGRISWPALGLALGGAVVLAGGAFLLLPAPTVGIRIGFLSEAGSGGAVPVAGALAGDSGQADQLSQPGSPSGLARVGGYLGFAGDLDTALRGQLSHTVVMRVRAERPTYWIGETFDTWSGQSWSERDVKRTTLRGASPFDLPVPEGDTGTGPEDLQTFYVVSQTADLIFHADSAEQVWFAGSTLYDSGDGTVVSSIALGRGAVYTVESRVEEASGPQLAAATGPGLPAALQRRYTQLPHAYARVRTLAESITAGDPTTYAKVEALIAWIGAHTRYSTDIPPLPRGGDTVDAFLFGDRVGFCEQISTAMAVMLRSLDIPAREAVGYVPGSYNPVTDLYVVEADDAHAWVQVWFPGYGWQSFDPTAVVPLANPDPGAIVVADIGRALRGVPWAPVSGMLAVVALTVLAVLRYRRRPANWAERVARDIERAGRRAGHPRRPAETLGEYAEALDRVGGSGGSRGSGGSSFAGLAAAVEESAYGGREPPPAARRELVALARRARR